MFRGPRGMWTASVFVLILGLLVSACTSTGGQTSTEADPNGELVTNTASEPDTIDPQKVQFTQEIGQAMMVFEGLMTLDPTTLKPVPAAAKEAPTISADGRTWKFTLRDGLKFSDGSPLSAKDFAYGFARTCDPATASAYASVLFVVTGCQEWNALGTKAPADALEKAKASLGIKVLSDKELQFTLNEAAPYFSSIAYMWVGMPVRESDVLKGGEKWTEPATYIGNGPFRLAEWKHNEKLVFERNPNYRLPVKLKKWTKLMISEGSVSFAAYRNDQLDVAAAAAEDLRTIESEPDLKAQLVDVGGASTAYYGFNVSRAPFNDQSMRMAFAKAFDRTAFARDVQKIGVAADGGFVPPGIPGFDKDDTIQKFDVAEAKRLFDAARPESKAALKGLKFSYAANAANKTRIEWVTAQWKLNLGVEIALDPVDRTAYSAMLKKPETTPDMFLLSWSADFPDPQNWLSTMWLSKSGIAAVRTGYSNPEFDGLVRAADRELDPKKREELYQRAGRLLSKDAPAAWLFYGARKYVKKPWVKGIVDTSIDVVVGQLKLNEIYVTKKA